MQLNRTPNALTKADRDDLNKNWASLEEEINRLGPAPELAALAKLAADDARKVANGIDSKVVTAIETADAAKSVSFGAINTANRAELVANSVQKQFNAVVVAGDSSPQAEQASVGVDGTDYGGNLKARLDAEQQKTIEQLAEIENFNLHKTISKLENGESVVIVFLGDSTTEQNATTNGFPNIVGLIANYLKNKYGADKVTVINSGISGQNIHMMWARLFKDVLYYKPDAVFICSGINDANSSTNKIPLAKYIESYNGLIQEILATTDCDIVLRTPNWTKGTTENANLLPYNQVVRDVAKKYNTGFYDMFEAMKADIENGTKTASYWFDSDEVVHPNENGHQDMFGKFVLLFQYSRNVQKPLNDYLAIDRNGINVPPEGSRLASVNYFNGGITALNSPGKFLEFEYTGGDFIVIANGGGTTGQFKVSIDGVERPEIYDTYSNPSNARMRFTVAVPYGKHTVRIIDQATKNAASTSTNIQIQGILYKQEKIVNQQSLSKGTVQNDSGSFSPVVLGSAVAGLNTYTTQLGNYFKINNRVFFEVQLVLSAKDVAMSGDVRIGNLPFTAKNLGPTGNADYSCSIGLLGRMSYGTAKQITAQISKGSNYINLYKVLDNASQSALNVSEISDIFRVSVSGNYDAS